jgi:pentatricopeptide repeat protein
MVPFTPSKSFFPKFTGTPSIRSVQCHSSISEQLLPISLTLLKEPTHGESASSKPTWVNPTKPKPDIISQKRQRKTKPGSNRNLSASVNPTLIQALNSIPDSDKAVYFSTISDAFPSPPTRDDVLFLLKSLSCPKSILFLEWLKETSFEMETIFYNLVLKSLRAASCWDPIDRIAREMLDEGPLLDNITYSTIVTAAHKCRKFDKAIEWFDIMYSAGVIPDEVTFSSVLKVYATLGKKGEAFILYERGRAAGWKPDHVCHPPLLLVKLLTFVTFSTLIEY